ERARKAARARAGPSQPVPGSGRRARRSPSPDLLQAAVRGSSFAVREGGLGPPRPCGHWHLRPARLPIPPLAPTRLDSRILVGRTRNRRPRNRPNVATITVASGFRHRLSATPPPPFSLDNTTAVFPGRGQGIRAQLGPENSRDVS